MSSASTDCLTLICRCPSGPRHINCIPSFFCMHTTEHRAINYTGVYLQKEPFPLSIHDLLIFSGVTISSCFSFEGHKQTLFLQVMALTYFNCICLYLVRKLISMNINRRLGNISPIASSKGRREHSLYFK